MNTGWETKLLRECTIKIASGATPKGGKESYLDRGISLIRSQNIHDFRFSIDGLAFIDTDQAHNLRNVIVEENDVLVNITGDSVARVCSAPKEHLPARVNQHVAIIRPRKDLLNWIFLKYYLLSPGEKANLLMLSSSGATRNALTKGMLENLKINLPPLPEQKAIAHILGTLDEKVELNRKMNQTLEAMAQALFKSWFVDFDPVIDNAVQAGNVIPEELQARAEKRRHVIAGTVIASAAKQSSQPLKPLFYTNPALAAQFPASFVFNETLGKWIPEGWEVKTTGELIDVRDGTHDSPQQSKKGYPLITSRHITSGYLDFSNTYLISEEDYKKVNKRSRVQTGDILLTMIGTVGIPCLILKKDIDFAIKNVGLFRTSESPIIKSYFFQLLKTESMQSYLEARMAGTTQKYLSLKVLRNIDLVSPQSNVLDHYNTIQEPWESKIYQNQTEIETLTQLRDRLLPELISGRVRVKERMIEND